MLPQEENKDIGQGRSSSYRAKEVLPDKDTQATTE